MKNFQEPKSERAFTLLEVMIAIAIFFTCMFAILGVVSNSLRNARALQKTDVNVGMAAAQFVMTNKLYEGSQSGDFGDIYPDSRWDAEVTEVSSNGLFRVDFTAETRVGKSVSESRLSILLFRPESPPGSMSGGMKR